MSEQKLRAEEVCFFVGISIQTLNIWYRWKKMHPDEPLAKYLPDYEQVGPRKIRYWKESDINTIKEFKTSIPHGRNGILGEITQKYLKNKEN